MPWSWATFQQNVETLITDARWICAAVVPAFITVNSVWGIFSEDTANKILQTFLALGFLSAAQAASTKKE